MPSSQRSQCDTHALQTVLRLLLCFLSPFAIPNRRFSFETKLSGRAVHWQQSPSQSSDRWTMFALGGPRVWQQDLGITIQRFSPRTGRSNSESVEPRVHWRSQDTEYTTKQNRLQVTVCPCTRMKEGRNNVQCSLPPICKLVAAYQGLHRSFHNGPPQRSWLPITL